MVEVIKEKQKNPIAIAKTTIMFLIPIVLGLIIINQYMDYRFKNEFLLSPCELCKELNPHLDSCFKQASNIYTDVDGNLIINITEHKKNREVETFNLSSVIAG